MVGCVFWAKARKGGPAIRRVPLLNAAEMRNARPVSGVLTRVLMPILPYEKREMTPNCARIDVKSVPITHRALRSNLHLAAFHRREIVLADSNAFGELLLRHMKAAHLPNAATVRIAGSLRADRTLGLIRSLLLAISFSLSNEVSLLLHFAFASRKKALKVLGAFLLVRRYPTS